MDSVDMLNDIKDCFDQAGKPDQLTHTTKQYLLSKVVTLTKSKGPNKLAKNREFNALLTDIG